MRKKEELEAVKKSWHEKKRQEICNAEKFFPFTPTL